MDFQKRRNFSFLIFLLMFLLVVGTLFSLFFREPKEELLFEAPQVKPSISQTSIVDGQRFRYIIIDGMPCLQTDIPFKISTCDWSKNNRNF